MILNINFCFYLKFKIGLNFFLNLNGLKWVYLFIYSLTYEYKYIFYFYKIKNVLIFFELKSLLWLWKVLAEHIISCFKVWGKLKYFSKFALGNFEGKIVNLIHILNDSIRYWMHFCHSLAVGCLIKPIGMWHRSPTFFHLFF